MVGFTEKARFVKIQKWDQQVIQANIWGIWNALRMPCVPGICATGPQSITWLQMFSPLHWHSGNSGQKHDTVAKMWTYESESLGFAHLFSYLPVSKRRQLFNSYEPQFPYVGHHSPHFLRLLWERNDIRNSYLKCSACGGSDTALQWLTWNSMDTSLLFFYILFTIQTFIHLV